MRSQVDEERRLFKRIVVSSVDLQQAGECAHHILRLGLHSSTDREDRSLLKCLNTALVIAYTRPFSGNKGSADVRKRLPSEYLDVLSDEQRQLHDELLRIRDQDQAHSDAGGLDMTVRVSRVGSILMAIPIRRNAIAPLAKGTVEQAVELIDCLQGKLAEEHVRIQETLKEGECF